MLDGKELVRGRGVNLGLGALLLFAFVAFAGLPMLGILAYTYQRSEASAFDNLEQQVRGSMDDTMRSTADMVDVVARTMAIVGAAVARNPQDFRLLEGSEVLYRALVSADQMDAIYTSFEDGYHRVVSRIDGDRRRADPQIPAAANWHVSHIDSFTAGAVRARHRYFYSAWGRSVGDGYAVPTTLDLRTLPHYADAKRTGALALGEPAINPDTGTPVMSLGLPVVRDGAFIGFVGVNLTLASVSEYLRGHRVSPNSITLVADRDGNLLASSDPALVAPSTGNTVVLPRADAVQHPAVARALAIEGGAPRVFAAGDGQEYIAMTASFPASFGKDWRVVAVSPTDDFIGELRRTNRNTAAFIAAIILFDALLLLLMARRLGRAVRTLVGEFDRIGRFNLVSQQPMQSVVREISTLSRSTERMKAGLRSFGRYVPADLVRDVLASGSEAQLGGERRPMTIQFSDIAGFTSISEKLTPEALVDELGEYFGLMREALFRHHGTLDKYMGDGILAFFNAPARIENHEAEACDAALEAQEMLAADRIRRAALGRPPFSARIGIACGEVLVGNIGTPDRFSYTVIGDSVNLASRLEGVCKFYGVAITASGEVKAATGDAFEWRHLDRVAVVGRTGGTDIHELLGRRGEVDARRIAARDAYEAALADYFAGQFNRAAGRFRELAEDPSDLAAMVMARRSRKLHRAPPEGEWNGIYVHTKK